MNANKSFTDLFIRRPVFASVLSLVIFLFGLIAYFKLPLRQFPKIDATTVSINTSFSGASPSLMESQVTTPIESAIASVDGLNYIKSSSTEGESTITLKFNLGYNINTAIADVMNQISSVRWELPKGINDPVVNKEDPNALPILFVTFTNPNQIMPQISSYVVNVIQPVLSTLPGVGDAEIYNQDDYAMRLWLNPFQMTAQNITLDDVMNAMQQNNLQAPTGRIDNSFQEFNTTVATDLSTADEFNNLVIKEKNGKLIRLNAIGYAKLGTLEQRVKVLVNGKQAIIMGIVARTDSNPLTVANEVKATLNRLAPMLPSGMKAQVVWDNSSFISDSIKEVKHTIIEAVVCVLIVIFLFLGSLRAILVPLVTIPLSTIGVCGLMFAMGYSLNTMTFLAFVLAIGMVVDDAIVVSENVHRHIELGKSRLNAALIGASEIRFAVIAMTLTLAAVYTPILFTTGITGALFKEFAFTLACTVIISGFVALTLSPMMCSKALAEKDQENKLEKLIIHVTDFTASTYKKFLRWILKFRPFVLATVVVILGGCYFLYTLIPQELAPMEDMGGLLTMVMAPASANINYTEKYAKEVAKIYQSIPEAVFNLPVVGYPKGVNSAIVFLTLKPWSERHRTVNQIIAALFPKLMGIPGVLAFPVNPFSLPGSSELQGVNFVIKTTGSYQQLNNITQEIKNAASQNPNLSNVDVDLKIDQPQYDITINRNLAGTLGISMSAIGNALNMALGQPEFNRFVMDGRSYYVIPQIQKHLSDTPEALNNLTVRTASGRLVPLANFVTIKSAIVPQSLDHFQEMRAATITASPAPGHSLGEALTALNQIAKKYLQPGMQIDYAGESRQFIEASGEMALTFTFAIIFIFLVLAAQFESFRDPLIIMFSVPLSTFGALVLLKLSGGTINIYTQIGLVTLVGLISKHGILMVEFANQLQSQGKEKVAAIVEAATIRLRPILMTTAAMILGALPLALASGAGAESRHQIGIVIIGGMFLGTLFTLFVVPTVYTYLATVKQEEFQSIKMPQSEPA